MSSNDRFQRHELIDWFDQEKVSAMHALVVGAGAIGNELIKNLVLLGVKTIDVHDFDTMFDRPTRRVLSFLSRCRSKEQRIARTTNEKRPIWMSDKEEYRA